MSRETDRDRANEQRIASDIAARRGLRQFKIGTGNVSRIDRAFVNAADRVVFFAEVKRCNYQFGKTSFGGGYKIHDEKVYAAAGLHWATDCPVYLVVEFDDCRAWLDMIAAHHEVGHQLYRRDRNEWQEAVLFPWDQFTRRAMTTTNEPTTTTAAVT